MAEDTKVVETSNEVKFTEEELQGLQSLQNGYQEKQTLLGQLAVQRILLDQQSDALETRKTEVETEYESVQQQERDREGRWREAETDGGKQKENDDGSRGGEISDWVGGGV